MPTGCQPFETQLGHNHKFLLIKIPYEKGALGLAAPSKNHAANVADGSKTDIDGLGADVG